MLYARMVSTADEHIQYCARVHRTPSIRCHIRARVGTKASGSSVSTTDLASSCAPSLEGSELLGGLGLEKQNRVTCQQAQFQTTLFCSEKKKKMFGDGALALARQTSDGARGHSKVTNLVIRHGRDEAQTIPQNVSASVACENTHPPSRRALCTVVAIVCVFCYPSPSPPGSRAESRWVL